MRPKEPDSAWTPKEKRNLKILATTLAIVALVCCGAGIGLGVALA